MTLLSQHPLVGADTDRDVAAHRTVFGLIAGIGGDVTAHAPPLVVGGAVIQVRRSSRRSASKTRSCPSRIRRGPSRHLQAHVGAGNVIEPDPVQAANLHVLDRLGLYGKIGGLRPSYGNETRCRAKEKAFHALPRTHRSRTRRSSSSELAKTLSMRYAVGQLVFLRGQFCRAVLRPFSLSRSGDGRGRCTSFFAMPKYFNFCCTPSRDL